MGRGKNYLELDKEKDTNYYRICNELSLYGKSIIQDIDAKPWWSTLRKQIGYDSKKLTDGGTRLLLPPVTNRRHRFGIVSIPNTVTVVKKEGHKKTRFKFLKGNL